MNVLVIGSKGQLASELKTSLNSKKLKFIFLGKKKIDIFSVKDILSKIDNFKISIIINCAAYTNVDQSELKKKQAYKLNCEAVKNLVKVCKQKKIYLIHFSSDYVFKGTKSNYKENDDLNPLNYYGKTKQISEKIITTKLKNFIIFRISWLIGNYSNNFLKKIIFNLKRKKKVFMVNDQISNPTMTFLVSKIIKISCENFFLRKNILNGVFHLSNEPSISKLEFTKIIYKKLKNLKLIKNKCTIIGVSSNTFKSQANRPVNSSFNLSKIKKKLNIKNLSWKKNINKILIKS